MNEWTTRDVCERLDVSRFWVNTYLRKLGHRSERNGQKVICYNPKDLLQYFNENAECSRQTMWIPETAEVKGKYIPFTENRGQWPWVPCDITIQSLDDLVTVNQYLKRLQTSTLNNEVAYRNFFKEGYVKIKVHGRKWWMPAPEKREGMKLAICEENR